MANFGIEPSVPAQPERIRTFVAEEIEPLDLAFGAEHVVYNKAHPVHEAAIRPLPDRVRARFPPADTAEAMRGVFERHAVR